MLYEISDADLLRAARNIAHDAKLVPAAFHDYVSELIPERRGWGHRDYSACRTRELQRCAKTRTARVDAEKDGPVVDGYDDLLRRRSVSILRSIERNAGGRERKRRLSTTGLVAGSARSQREGQRNRSISRRTARQD